MLRRVLFCRYVFKFCSPSRSQTLTGRFAYHLGQQTELNLNPQTCVPFSSPRLRRAVLDAKAASAICLLSEPDFCVYAGAVSGTAHKDGARLICAP